MLSVYYKVIRIFCNQPEIIVVDVTVSKHMGP